MAGTETETEDEAMVTAEADEERGTPLDSYYRLSKMRERTGAGQGKTYRFKWNVSFSQSGERRLYGAASIPGGIVKTYQLRGLAQVAKDLTTGYCQITTRANLQIRLTSSAPGPPAYSVGRSARGNGRG